MRVSKVVVSLIFINVIIFMIALFLTSSQRREIIRLEENIRQVDNQMVKIEREFVRFKEIMADTPAYLSAEEARREFKRILRKNIAEGKIIPPGLAEYDQWSTLYANLKKLEEELLLKKEGFFYSRFGFIPKDHDALTILTSSFLHISLFSLFFNMLFLLIVGSILEDRWGGYFLTLIYLGGGIFGCLIHWAFAPFAEISIVGSSSAVAAVMGVFVVACFKERIKLFFWFHSSFIFILWLVQLIFQPIFEPVEMVNSQGIFAPLTVLGLGIVVGLARTGRLSKPVKEAAPTSPYYRMINQGNELLELARFDMARAVFEHVISKEPENLEAHEGLARIYTYKNQEKEAISEYNRVIEIAIRESRDALKRYETFKRLYPEAILEPRSLYRLASLLEEEERLTEAIETYRKLYQGYPEDDLSPKALFAIGKIYLRLGQNEEAINTFEEILTLYPALGWIGEVEEAIERIRLRGLGP